MNTQTVIFMGPQGSGKGTQVTKLKEYLEARDTKEVVVLQTGARFRELMEHDSYTGRETDRSMKEGRLSPLFLAIMVWGKEMLDHLNDTNHALLDGLTRRLDEMPAFESALSFYKREHITVVYINLPEEVVIERMKGRGRSDDTEEGIKTRLDAYTKETLPVVSYFKERANTNFIEIDGAQSIEDVHTDVLRGLGI